MRYQHSTFWSFILCMSLGVTLAIQSAAGSPLIFEPNSVVVGQDAVSRPAAPNVGPSETSAALVGGDDSAGGPPPAAPNVGQSETPAALAGGDDSAGGPGLVTDPPDVLANLTCAWGSFDGSRINYTDGQLTGNAHSTLRSIITSNGGSIAPPTPTLTPAYLSTVDVFYTSLLSTSTGALAPAEQTALQNWIAAGGTLIVSADILSLPAYESFTSFYQVTNYQALSHSGSGSPVTAHPITNGVSSYAYATECTFTYGPDALLLGNNGFGNDFMVVLEPATGFLADGRILVLGDHNMLTNSLIGNADNTLLANNIAAWACTPPSSCAWGSFDGSRINYASGPLTGSAHSTLRSIITSNGGYAAPPTPTLTPAYLSTVDVFYTSLLSTSTGALAPAEQTALQNWIAAGGTLIVSADILSLPAYESFTSFYQVTNYQALSHSGSGSPVTAHPITNGVSSYAYATECTFTYGPDALLLGNNGFGNDFMVVLEPATGFLADGRILVLGDHNMLTNSLIGNADNTLLANNIAAWACTPPSSCAWGSFDGSRINYASGPLTGSAHSTLRSIITSNGGYAAPPTPTLTPAYLSTVDVFYTSLLSTSTGALAPAEQTALQNWIAAGGTLIVSADILSLPAYESFTSFYQVTNYQALSHSGSGSPVTAHPITNGVSSYAYATECTFTYGPDALLLGNNGFGNDFMVVLEPATGFLADGRILVLGDHNMLTNSLIGNADNTLLANNIAAWACAGGTTGVAEAPPVAGTLMVSVAPNPFSSATAFHLDTDAGGRVEVRVYDVAGRQVARLSESLAPSGSFELPWDGRDASGRDLARGTYFYRVTGPTGTPKMTGKLIKIQ